MFNTFQVQLSFLSVGHTHEDIDAAFHQIADSLRTTDAETLTELLGILPNVQEIHTGGMYDFRSWLEPCINSIQYHTKPLHYRFKKDHSGNLLVHYKGNHDRPWKHLGDRVLHKMPSGTPLLLQPDFDNLKLERIEKQINSWRSSVSDGVINWWQRFIKNINNIASTQERLSSYARKGAIWQLPLLPRQVDEIVENNSESVVSEHVQWLFNAEVEDPEVIYSYIYLSIYNIGKFYAKLLLPITKVQYFTFHLKHLRFSPKLKYCLIYIDNY